MKKIQLEQGSPEWLAYRQDKIGASDCPIIMGVSPWQKPGDLYKNKLGITKLEKNWAMQRGVNLEGPAREAFMLESGIYVEPCVGECEKNTWMIASFDGLSLDDKVAVEIKCPGKKDHDLALNGQIPEKYFSQLQHLMAVSGLECIYYYSFN